MSTGGDLALIKLAQPAPPGWRPVELPLGLLPAKTEQEEAKRREELKALLEQEERMSRLNRLKIMNQWRKLMRLVKVEDLRKDIEVVSQNHEREVDRKDAIIQVLDRDLEDSEQQYQTALRYFF